jgi:hypothetical protein
MPCREFAQIAIKLEDLAEIRPCQQRLVESEKMGLIQKLR